MWLGRRWLRHRRWRHRCWRHRWRRRLHRPQRDGLGGWPARPVAPRRLLGSHRTRPLGRITQWAQIGLTIARAHCPLRTQRNTYAYASLERFTHFDAYALERSTPSDPRRLSPKTRPKYSPRQRGTGSYDPMLQRRRATDATQVHERGRRGRRRHKAMRNLPCPKGAAVRTTHSICDGRPAVYLRALLFALPLIP